MSRKRDWCFTVNNTGDDETASEFQKVCPEEELDYRYLVYQLELGTNLHYQGYVQFAQQQRKQTLVNKYPAYQWIPAEGNWEQNLHYCSKPTLGCSCVICLKELEKKTKLDGPWIYGAPSYCGKRNDLLRIQKKVDDKVPLEIIWKEDFELMCRNHKSVEAYKFITQKHRPSVVPEVVLLYGSTGAGKSHRAQEMYPNAFWLSDGKWWDGYEDQEEVVIDDFYGWIPYHQLLRILDKYPYSVQVKQGTRKLQATKFVITSNNTPDKWYDYGKIKGDVETINRRITQVIEFTVKDFTKTGREKYGSIKIK